MTDADQHSTADSPAGEPPAEDEAAQWPSPGAILREHRQAQNLELREVANDLHLTMHFVDALESDRYDKLPGDVFVRGYMRKYAELLQISPEEVLEAYRRFQERRHNRREQARERQEQLRKERNRPWIVISGVAFVLVAVVLWFVSEVSESESANAVADIGSSASTSPAATGTAGSQTLSATGDNDGGTGQQSPTVARMDSSRQAGSLHEAERAPTVDADGEVDSQPEPADQASGDEPATGDDEPQALALDWQGEDELQLQVSAESWVEVEDEDEAQDHGFADLLDGGDSLVVRGQAPFNILLGNAPAVSLRFNGRDIDISDSVREDNSARLTIGL